MDTVHPEDPRISSIKARELQQDSSSDKEGAEPTTYGNDESDEEEEEELKDADLTNVDESLKSGVSVKDEQEEKIDKSNKVKIISTVGTMFVLLFGGAGAIYGIEGKNEEQETGSITEWKYLNCLYFCTVTLTTIGYGDITPKTQGGKAFVVIYALVSLGVMAAAITTIGQIVVYRASQQKNEFFKVSKMFTKKLKRLTHMGEHEKRRAVKEISEMHLKDKKEKWYKWYLRIFGLLLLITMVMFIGAVAFHHFEGWTYADSVYYCFITLLTIGYGDFYPNTDNGKIFFIFYAFIGLGLLAFVVGDVGEKIISQTNQKLQEAKIRKALLSNLQYFPNLTKFKTPKIPGVLRKNRKSKEKKEKEKEKEEQQAKEEAEREQEREKEREKEGEKERERAKEKEKEKEQDETEAKEDVELQGEEMVELGMRRDVFT